MHYSSFLYKPDQVGSEWEVVGVANNSQRGTSERVREKMLLKSGTDTQGLIELATCRTQHCGQDMHNILCTCTCTHKHILYYGVVVFEVTK